MKSKGIDIQFHPSVKQSEALRYLFDNVTNFVGYGGSGNSGKSYLECYWLTIMCIRYPGTGWFLGRQTLTILKDTILKTLFKVFNEASILPERDYKLNSQTNIITFSNKSEIFLLDLAYSPSDPMYTWLGGYEFTGGAIDESGECHPTSIEMLSTRTGRRLNDKYKLTPKILETFNPLKNHVYSRYYKPSVDGTMTKEYMFIKALPSDNPAPEAKEWVERLLKTADRITIERLIYGNFEYDDDPLRLMEYDKILDCFTNYHVPKGKKCITADIARLGGDRIVVIEWDGMRGKVRAAERQKLDVTGQMIEDSRYRIGCGVSDVLVDEDGIGGGIVDFLKYKGFVNNSQPLLSPDNPMYKQNFDNLKSQCSYGMADLVNANGLFLECEAWMKPLIIQEMEVVKQKAADNDNKKGVLPKDKVKELIQRSPDFWDTIMMRYWFELKPKFVLTAVAV